MWRTTLCLLCEKGGLMTKLTYEEWSKQNPIDWDLIEKNASEDCLVTLPFVEMAHRWEYQLYCEEND